VSSDLSRVACVIPAKDEEQRIAATVTAARDLPGVEIVIVCDDGSSDRTSEHAAGAGAIVVSHSRNRGKAAAVESAVNGLGVIEQRDKLPEAGSLLLLDADLAESAANCAPLIDPVVKGEADLTIAVLPAQLTADEIVNIAAYFSAQPGPETGAKSVFLPNVVNPADCYARMPSILGPLAPESIANCVKKGATVGHSPSATEQARKNLRAQMEELLR